MTETPKSRHFSQRRPFLFGFALLAAAMIALFAVMAVARYALFGGGPGDLAGVSGDKIGVVRVEGVILDSRRINDWIKRLREDTEVLGVVLRVDSPGGGVGASQEIHRAVARLAEAKPVVVSMGAVAASGGYYVSAPAQRIVANPGTVTGSIGVRMTYPDYRGLADKLGLDERTFTSGRFKDAGNPMRPMSEDERQLLEGVVMDMYDQFLTAVAEGREMDKEDVRPYADGRILTGRQALEAGLVDELGGMEEAFAAVKVLAGVTGVFPVVEGPPEETHWLREMILGSVKIFARELSQELHQNARPGLFRAPDLGLSY